MNESQILSNTIAELDLDKWWNKMLGQPADYEKLDIEKVYDNIPRTELKSVEVLYSKLQNRLTYSSANTTWYLWDGHIHRPCEGDDIAVKVVKHLQGQIDEAIRFVKTYYNTLALKVESSGINNADKEAAKIRDAYNKGEIRKHKMFRDNLTGHRTQQNVVAQMKVAFGVAADHFDQDDRDWFVTDNCVIDVRETTRLRQVVVKPHDPSRAVWRAYQGSYEPSATNPALVKFLTHSFADSSQAEYFAKVVGTAMIGAPAKMKTIVDVYGATDGGKSMINTVIEKLAPKFYFEATDNAIIRGGKDADRYRDEMRLARIITFLEVKAKLDKSFVLKYTGGDIITTDRKYRNALQWRSQGVILMMSNEGMNIGSQEPAIADRIERVNFPHSFSKDSENPDYEKDPELGMKIIADSSGFLNWMLWGYINHLNDNVDGKPKASESMAFLKAELQDTDNTMAIFWEKALNTKYVWQQDAPAYKMIPFTVVYANYRQWCKETSMKVMEESDVKAWMKRENLVARISSQLRLNGYVEVVSRWSNISA